MSAPRHKWGADVVHQYATVQTCERCGLVKVRRHEPAARYPWTEFVRDCERVQCDGTPPCVPAEVEASAGTAVQHDIAASACRREPGEQADDQVVEASP